MCRRKCSRRRHGGCWTGSGAPVPEWTARLGAAVAGWDSAPGRNMLEHTGDQPAGRTSCIGMAESRSPQVAALHNGIVSHVVEMDDVHRAAIIHPGVVVVPAALAVAEQVGASGKDFLTAVT